MKKPLVATAVASLLVGGAFQASAAPAVYKVTGGGQITSDGLQGAGDTIAFTAQSADESGDLAKGQLQYNKRSGTPEKFHGVVTCVVVQQAQDDMPAMARIEGYMRGETDTAENHFVVDVVDDGQGQDAMDMVSLRHGYVPDGNDADSDSTCDLDDDFQRNGGLGRGNVKIHKDKA